MKRTAIRCLGMPGVYLMVSAWSLSALSETETDNTKQNKKIYNSGAVTVGDQNNTSSDRDLVAKIRRAIVEDDSISTHGHNVKIVVTDGDIVLKGPVANNTEKKRIEQIAINIAGSAHVKNELKILR